MDRITTLDHSLFVAYWSYRAARTLGLDEAAAARGGLLHDLYLYDSKDKSAHPGCSALTIPAPRPATPAELTAALRQGAQHHPVPHVAAGRASCPAPGRPGWWTWWTPSAPPWSWRASITPAVCGSRWAWSPFWRRASPCLPPADGHLTAVPAQLGRRSPML